MQRTRALLAAYLLVVLAQPARASGAAVDSNGRWAGIENDARAATRASVEFVVPAVTDECGSGATSNAAVWVGIGGGVPFAQLGVTLAPESRGAWFELFDRDGHGPVRDIPLAIDVGDRIRIRLAFTGDHTSLLFVWNNLTSGKRVERSIGQARRWYSGDAVEWIVERSRQTLADFGRLTFDNAHYTDATGRHDLTPVDYEAAIYTGGQRATRTTVNSSTSATVKWLDCA